MGHLVILTSLSLVAVISLVGLPVVTSADDDSQTLSFQASPAEFTEPEPLEKAYARMFEEAAPDLDLGLYCPIQRLTPAKPCDPYNCHLPNCRCSGTDIPGRVPISQTPMMIVLSFQSAVNVINMRLYTELFQGRQNPNGCPATGTFFVSAKYTDFYDVQTLYSRGHEISSNGAVEENLPDFWDKATVTDWCQQIYDNRVILSTFARIPSNAIEGFRTPYLYMGGNAQFQAYKNRRVRYDGTRVAVNHKGKPNLMWPYTYEYMSTQDCTIGQCPNASFPGIWQMPLEALADPRDVPCADLGGCSLKTAADVYNTLVDAYHERKAANKAPMMIAINSAFLLTDYKMNGLKLFLDHIERFHYYDTFLTSADRALDWIQNPSPIKKAHCFRPPCPYIYPAALGCSMPRPKPCNNPLTCHYGNNRKFVPGGAPGIIYTIRLCSGRCPGCYPTLGDPQGQRC